MFGKRRKFGNNEEEASEEMSLQITSMADIFTIILVFLLKSFSTGLASITPSQGITLPNVSTPVKNQVKEALKVEILPYAILVDHKAVAKMNNFVRLDSGVVAVDPVFQALYRERNKNKEKNPADLNDSNLLLMADESTPYSTLQGVMASAANAGYVDLQLVVVQSE